MDCSNAPRLRLRVLPLHPIQRVEHLPPRAPVARRDAPTSAVHKHFRGVLIVYFFFLAVRFTKKTSSRLEKWIGGFTVAICIIEAAKVLLRFAPEPFVEPIARYFAASVFFGIASLLATCGCLRY